MNYKLSESETVNFSDIAVEIDYSYVTIHKHLAKVLQIQM